MSRNFGVTCLGPPNPFQVTLLASMGVTNFSDEEFHDAWENVQEGDQVIRTEIYRVLTTCYGFEPMPEELNFFVSKLGLDQERDPVTWDEFLDVIITIREELKIVAKNGIHFKSYEELRLARGKHTRNKNGPMEIFRQPFTMGQEYGWHEEEVENERRPKKSCAETKHAEALIKAGVDVYY